MSDAGERRRATRVLVALDESPDGLAALEAAAALAEEVSGELAGLFVEDDRLLRVAGLPFTSEVGIGTASRRPLSVSDVERHFASIARHVQQQLERIARRARVRWTFEVTRGALLRQTLDRAQRVDFVIIGRHGLVPRTTARGLRPAKPVPPPLLVVFDDSPAALRTLAAAASLARDRHTTLDIYLACQGSGNVSLLQSIAISELTQQAVVGRVHPRRLASSDELVDFARRLQPQLVLLSAANPLVDEKLLESLVADLACPVAIGY